MKENAKPGQLPATNKERIQKNGRPMKQGGPIYSYRKWKQ